MAKARGQNGLTRVKGTDRIQIINILAAACIAVLSVLLGLSGQRFSGWMIAQLAVAIPLLVTSSLAYAKVGYRDVGEYPLWDGLGWATLSVGYIMTLNALAIMLHTGGYVGTYWWFIGTTVLLDVVVRRDRLKEKAWKSTVYLVLIFAGAVLPILVGWA